MPKFLVNILCQGGGWACVRWGKIDVVQKCWVCVSACTSFNFMKR